MGLRQGNGLWIPCEVKEGPFEDERIVRVKSSAGESVVFVQIDFLKEPIKRGSTFVLGVVTDVNGRTFKARLAGQSINSRVFEGEIEKVVAA